MGDKFEIIMNLMEELREEMQPSHEDLGSRLGREPKVEVAMEVEEPMEGDELAMDGEGVMDPESKLKERLLKLRG